MGARGFLLKVKENEENLQRMKSPIYGLEFKDVHEFPELEQEKFSWALLLFLALISDGILAIIYALYSHFRNKKIRKRNEKIMNSTKEIERCKRMQKVRTNNQLEIDEKTAAYKKFYADNSLNYLGFLPEWVRNIETIDDITYRISYIDGLIGYVKVGASNLNEAIEQYSNHLIELDEMEKRKELQDEREKRHREEMDALDTIAKNQEKTNDELNKIYTERFHKRY